MSAASAQWSRGGALSAAACLLLAGVAVFVLGGCGGTPVEPPRPNSGDRSGPFGLADGPYASVDEVPVAEAPAFRPTRPSKLVLTNGLNVILQRDQTLPVVEVRIYLDAGSWDDPRGRAGVAEMAARVMREGGGAVWAGAQLDEELAFLGATLQLRAEDTRFVASMRCLEQDFTRVLGMLEDVVRAPTFPEEVIERVRGGMRAQLDARDDDPGAQADRESMRAYYGLEDPRARRLEAADLEAITRDDLIAFHRRHVGSRRTLIAMLGSLEAEEARTELDRRFGDWAGQIADARTPLPAPAAPTAPTVRVLTRDDVNQAEIRMLYPGVDLQAPDRPALLLGSYLLGSGGFGSRMVQRIRVELGLAYGVGARWRMPAGRAGDFRAYAATRSESFGTAVEEMLGVLQSYLQDGCSEEEFEHARSRWLHSQVFAVDTPGEVLWRTVTLERLGLPWDFHEATTEAVRALTPEQVLAACRRHLDPARLLLFVVGNPQAFDRPPGDFGEALAWEQGEGNGQAGGGAAAAELANRLLAHHGGAEVWSAVGSVSVEAGLNDRPTRVLMVYPDRMSWQYLDQDEPYLVLAGTQAWSPQTGALPAGLGEQASVICQAELPILLMQLARGELELESPAEGVLLATGPRGNEVRVDIGADGLVRRIVTETQEQTFSQYTLTSGVMLPARLEQKDEGREPFATDLVNWTMQATYEPALFQPPSE